MKLFTASRAVGLAGLIVTLAGTRLFAQDVTVTDPAWLDPENPGGDVLPKFKKAPSVDYPEGFKTQPGYLIATRFIGEDGKVTGRINWASHPYFKEGFEWEKGTTFLPAQKEGKPAGATMWYALLFNPKSAAEKRPNADVRLLAVAPVIVSKEKFSEVMGPKKGPATVWTRVKVDATGAASLARLDTEEAEAFRAGIEATLPLWRFAPARKDGVAVEAEVPAAFVVMIEPGAPSMAKKVDKMPVLKTDVRPVYPRALRAAGHEGIVLMRFTVDETGAVKNPVVAKSDHPAFEEPALEAVLKWTFKPALKDGKPVEIKIQQAVQFSLSGGGPRVSALNQPERSKKQQEKMPEELRYDVPPKATGVLYPNYPFDLLIAKTRGKARVAFVVNERGRVSGVKVVSADHPEFGESLAAALAAFEFVPASRDGKPVATLFAMDHEFEPEGGNGRLSTEDIALAATLRKHPEKILKPSALDSPLQPLSRRSPVFPETARREDGEALVEVIVDRDGRVRLPKIISASEPVLGYAAAQAASDWRFEPPKSQGKAVAVRVRVPFKFSPASKQPDAPAAKAGETPRAAGDS